MSLRVDAMWHEHSLFCYSWQAFDLWSKITAQHIYMFCVTKISDRFDFTKNGYIMLYTVSLSIQWFQ